MSNPITSVTGAQNQAASTTKAKAELDMKTFLKLLTVQLANQNPLEPMSDRDFFAQMAQLGQVQGIDKLQQSMDMSQAAGMIGKTVTAMRPMTDSGYSENTTVTGKVVRVTIRDGERILGVQEANGGIVDIKMVNVQEVKE